MVQEAMSRKVFEGIKRHIHFADNNNLDTNACYSLDEQMVPYTGKNSSKQTIRTKSIRFGYKNFVLCSDDGYPYFLDPYCEKKYCPFSP